MASLPLSLLSVSYNATKAFYYERIRPYSDPNPRFRKHILLVFPCFLILTFSCAASWSHILAYTKVWVFVPILLLFLVKLLVLKLYNRFKKAKKGITRQNGSRHEEEGRLGEETPDGDDDNLGLLKWKSIFNSLLCPCVVGHHQTQLFFLSSVSTFGPLLICIWLLPVFVQYNPMELGGEPPNSYCFGPDGPLGPGPDSLGNHSFQPYTQFCKFNLETGMLTDCNRKRLALVSRDDWKSVVRLCGQGEGSLHGLLWYNVILTVLLAVSLFLSFLLQCLSNPSHLLKCSNCCCRWCGGGIPQRSHLTSLVEAGDVDSLCKVLGPLSKKDRKKVVKRPDSEGNSLLHIACRRGHGTCVAALLLEMDAKITKNARHQTPAHLAASSGSLDCLKLLLESMTPTDIQAEDDSGQTILDIAVEGRQKEMSLFLLSTTDRCSVERKMNSYDWTHPGLDTSNPACVHGTARELHSVVKVLCKHLKQDSCGTVPSTVKSDDGDISDSVHPGGAEAGTPTTRMQDGRGSKRGRTPMSPSAAATPARKGPKHLCLLLKYLGEPGTGERYSLRLPLDANDEGPFQVAVEAKDFEACRILIDLRSEKKTMKSKSVHVHVGSLLSYALGTGSIPCCEMVLAAKKRSDWERLGCVANSLGNKKKAEGEKGYYKDLKVSVLHEALRKDDVRYLEFFLRHRHLEQTVLGGDVGRDLGRDVLDVEQDFFGLGLLHRASLEGREDVVKLLLGRGASPNAPSRVGELPLSFAALDHGNTDDDDGLRRRKERVVKLLLRAGANAEVAADQHRRNCTEEPCRHFSSHVKELVML